MKRADGLYDISRREFCALTGLAGLAITGCTNGGPAIQTGALGGDQPPDAAHHPGDGPLHDGTTSLDGNANACATTPTDVGAPGSFSLNNPTYFNSGNFFVVRDSGGLYALTARCTHEGATCVAESSDFYCPRHGATFNFDGSVLGGPVFIGLVHYAMCTMANGHVGVITSMQVSQSTRLVA